MAASDSKLFLDKRLILSVIGSDHPEIMTTISEILSRFKGIFVDTQFNSIHQHFSGTFSIAIHHMYMKPFMACLSSLTSEKVKFEFELLESNDPIIEQERQKIRFELSLWGTYSEGGLLEIFRLLNKNHLQVDSLAEKLDKADKYTNSFSSQLSVSSDYVVDIEEVELELQQKATELGINLMLLSEQEEMLEAM